MLPAIVYGGLINHLFLYGCWPLWRFVGLVSYHFATDSIILSFFVFIQLLAFMAVCWPFCFYRVNHSHSQITFSSFFSFFFVLLPGPELAGWNCYRARSMEPRSTSNRLVRPFLGSNLPVGSASYSIHGVSAAFPYPVWLGPRPAGWRPSCSIHGVPHDCSPPYRVRPFFSSSFFFYFLFFFFLLIFSSFFQVRNWRVVIATVPSSAFLLLLFFFPSSCGP